MLRDPVGNNGNEDEDRRERNRSESTFVFPVYRKGFRDLVEGGEVKLGKFVGLDSSRRRRGKVAERGISAGLKVDETSVIPVRGVVHPDGTGYVCCSWISASALFVVVFVANDVFDF